MAGRDLADIMDTGKIYDELKIEFEGRLRFLPDKPDENLDSTLKACWQFASGNPMSASEAVKHPLPVLDEKQLKVLHHLLAQRVKNVPLAYLTGRQNFMGIDFLSDRRALIPRKETELLGEKALELSLDLAEKQPEVNVMDLCCGSGNLGLAVAYNNPKVHLCASDLSEDAVGLVGDNAQMLGLGDRVRIRRGNLFSAFQDRSYYECFDLIICNPPYISSAKIKKMEKEIAAHEPVLAFDGGKHGFKIIYELIEKAPLYLRTCGWLLFEVGLGQGEFIAKVFESTEKYHYCGYVKDLKGNIRVLVLQKR